MNHREAKEMAAGNDASFLHICRSDIDTSEEAIHAPETYARAKENLEAFIRKGYLVRDGAPSFYIYRQIMWGRVQTGIVGCASVDEYANGTIKKHELTRREKELDRIEHFDACSAQTEPVFLAYRKHDGISRIIREWIKFHKPEYDFTTEDGVTHILWPVAEPSTVEAIRKGFEEVEALYIADGHHRTASSAAVSARRRKAHPDYTGQEEFNYLMAVVFCDEDLFIMDYNRVVRDLNGLSRDEFMERLQTVFDVVPADTVPGEGYAPRAKHEFGMYLDGAGIPSPPNRALSTRTIPLKAWTAPSSRPTCWPLSWALTTRVPATASTSWAASAAWENWNAAAPKEWRWPFPCIPSPWTTCSAWRTPGKSCPPNPPGSSLNCAAGFSSTPLNINPPLSIPT